MKAIYRLLCDDKLPIVYVNSTNHRLCRGGATIHWLWLVVLLLGLSTTSVWAGVSSKAAKPPPGAFNLVSVGFSVGSNYEKESSFWGLTAEYSRTLSDRWSVASSIAFDRDTERREQAPDKVVDEFNLILTVTYAMNDRWTVTTGLAKAFANDDNPRGELEFTDGDLSTGIAFGRAITKAVSWSFAWEWNISESDPSISTDLIYSWGF